MHFHSLRKINPTHVRILDGGWKNFDERENFGRRKNFGGKNIERGFFECDCVIWIFYFREEKI